MCGGFRIMELIIGNEAKHCPKCGELMKPTIFANPDLDPNELGNPWKCKCGEIVGCKDGTTYSEHIELIQKKYLKKDEVKE